ncbi:MAG: carboxypeptidase-like regulatory domain-containing protein, partial [Acidobacteriia bacterium]|nr:carboxypeptidase-like regulatory domain-containing protein [Terriglobia bacterium]
NSDWASTVNSDAGGSFVFNAVSLGEYTVTVAGVGFEQAQQDVMVVSGSNPVLHFALNVAGAKETVTVSSTLDRIGHFPGITSGLGLVNLVSYCEVVVQSIMECKR